MFFWYFLENHKVLIKKFFQEVVYLVHQIRITQIHFHSVRPINSRIRAVVCSDQIRTLLVLVACLVIPQIIVHLVLIQTQTVALDQILAVVCLEIPVIRIRTLVECLVVVVVDLDRPNHRVEHKRSSNLLCLQIQLQKVEI